MFKVTHCFFGVFTHSRPSLVRLIDSGTNVATVQWVHSLSSGSLFWIHSRTFIETEK